MLKENKTKQQLRRTGQPQRGHYRYSNGQMIAQRLGKIENLHRLGKQEKGFPRQALCSLKSIENQNLVSTIEMLKRQAELLDLQQDLGKVQKFSTLEHFDIFPNKQILLQTTKFRKQNIRKIAKGRPQVYNWVKNHKKQIVDMQCDYKTQILKKSSKQLNRENEKLDRLASKENRQTEGGKLEDKNRNHSSCKRSKRLTFVERLKRLEDVKQKGQIQQVNQQRRVHSENEQQRCSVVNLRTLC